MLFKSKKVENRPNIKELNKLADKYFKIITTGQKEEVNFVEARHLVYGVDLLKETKKRFNLEFTLEEKDIEKIDIILEMLANTDLDEKTRDGYISCLCGIFGIIANYYLGATWENRVWEDGYRMRISIVLTPVTSRAYRYINGNKEATFTNLYEEMKVIRSKLTD